MRSYHEQLQLHALNDLTNRAKSGTLMYLGVWLIIAYTYHLNDSHPDFFYLNTGIIALIVMLRVVHFIVLHKRNAAPIGFMNQWLVLTLLLAAGHWGGMTAWIAHDSSMDDMRTLVLAITPAFALGGACTLSISSEIRTLYPTFMLTPLIAVLIQQGGPDNWVLAGLIVFSLIYVFSSSRTTHNDYWKAITNHLVAEERAELMEKLSTTDPLTQLKNRMYFDKEFAQEWKRNSRLKCPLSLIMVDLDHFKEINDTYGHMFGDHCLRMAATAIANEVKRPTDSIARYGGEEFIVLLPNTDKKSAQMIAERMLAAVAELELEAEGKKISMTCSIGVATVVPQYLKAPSSLIKNADSALYYAKNAGRNRYCTDEDCQLNASNSG